MLYKNAEQSVFLRIKFDYQFSAKVQSLTKAILSTTTSKNSSQNRSFLYKKFHKIKIWLKIIYSNRNIFLSFSQNTIALSRIDLSHYIKWTQKFDENFSDFSNRNLTNFFIWFFEQKFEKNNFYLFRAKIWKQQFLFFSIRNFKRTIFF